LARALAVLGLLLLVLAGVFALVGPGQFVKYPASVDKSFDETGDMSFYVAPTTLTPAGKPLVLPLTVKVRLHTIGHSSNKIVMAEDRNENIGTGTGKADRRLVFAFDRGSVKNVTDSRAYAFDPSTVVDRSPNYAVGFPLHTGNGPYAVWKDETGTTFPMSTIADTAVGGVKLATLYGSMTGVPVARYYVTTLPAFVAKQLPLSRLSAALTSTHIDPVAIAQVVKGSLSASDNAAIRKILAEQVTLNFQLAAATTMIVEPTTGFVVSMNVDQTISAQPSVAQITKIESILSQPRYTDEPNVALAQGLIAKLAANPPSTKVVRIRYRSTPASVTALTHYAHHLATQMNLIETTIPVVLLVAGLVLFVTGLLVRVLHRKSGPASPSHSPPPSHSQMPSHSPPQPPRRVEPRPTSPASAAGDSSPKRGG
jgi:hypothetical protein